MWTVGHKKEYGTYNANMIYNDKDQAILMVFGIASNHMLEELNERDADGLAIANMVVSDHNELATLRTQLAKAREVIEAFAKEGREWGQGAHDTYHPVCKMEDEPNDTIASFTVGDLRAAAAAYLAKYPK